VKLSRFFIQFAALDGVLLAVFIVLCFTVFEEPTYVPFAAGRVTTLVPDGPHSYRKDGAWERYYFDGKGRLEIAIRPIAQFDLREIILRSRSDSTTGRPKPPPEGPRLSPRQDRGQGPRSGSEERDERPGGGTSRESRRSAPPRALPPAAMPMDDESTPREEELGSYIHILATNTPNLRLVEEIPGFDQTVFCLGAVGRGDRRYRYVLRQGTLVVDLHMHSPRSSHIVYKKVLDEALLNLRLDGRASNHVLAQALQELNGRISPRWAQGNTFWLLFFIGLPSAVMVALLPFAVRASRRTPPPRNPAPPPAVE